MKTLTLLKATQDWYNDDVYSCMSFVFPHTVTCTFFQFHFLCCFCSGGVRRMQKLKTLLVGAQGYEMFLLSILSVVGQNIALDAVPAYRASMPT